MAGDEEQHKQIVGLQIRMVNEESLNFADVDIPGIGVRQLHKLLTKYKIEKSEYKTSDRKSDEQKPEP